MPRVFRAAHVITTDLCVRFPKLAAATWSIKSPWDDRYKCIAWAACHTGVQWWPIRDSPVVHWPPGAPFDESVDAFVLAFSTLGYKRCHSRVFEYGYQKVAIYAASDHQVLHMARQHFFGRGWLSKCGVLEDIQHADLDSVAGDPSPLVAAAGRTYGVVDTILKRSWWAALTHLCVFRCAWAALRFWIYRTAYPSWDI